MPKTKSGTPKRQGKKALAALSEELNDRIVALSKKIAPNLPWSLCNLMENEGHAAGEKEFIIGETICACRLNLVDHKRAFSFDECDTGRHNGGLVDNGAAYRYLFSAGYFIAGKFKGKPTIIPTLKLIEKLEAYFATKDKKEAAKKQ